MEGLSRSTLYQYIYQFEEFEEIQFLRHTMQINNKLLSGIEYRFLSFERNELDQNEIGQQEQVVHVPDELSVDDFINMLNSNINHLNTDVVLNNDDRTLLDDVEKIIRSSENVIQNTEDITARRLFEKLLTALANYNNKIMKSMDLPVTMRFNTKNLTPVFLSYAYDDRLYTLSLFIYMYQHGIFLYVDWMHQGREDDGVKLKSCITDTLIKSEQLLFMRTAKSELKIDDGSKSFIRSWCSWELGFFYYQSKEEYLLNLYSVDNFENTQLHGMKLLTKVEKARLNGKIIRPNHHI